MATRLRCSKCSQRKKINDFYKDPKTVTGRNSRCKVCANKSARTSRQKNMIKYLDDTRKWRKLNPEKVKSAQLKTTYRIEISRYYEILSSQNGGCAICGSKDPGNGRSFFSVDHDHSCCPGEKACGKCIRGLLCDKCNRGLGQFRDDISKLLSAVIYLREYSEGK